MKNFRLFAIVFIAVLLVLTSCSGDIIGDQIGNIGDQIDNQLGDKSELKEKLITSVDEVLTKEGFKHCVNNLREYDFDQVEDWNAEIGSVVDLLGVLHTASSGEIVVTDFTAQYRNIRTNTVFVNYVLVSCASSLIPKLPYIDQYYDESVVINDWALELDAVVDSLEVLYESGIRSADDLLAEDSKLTGEMMMVFEHSELIKSFIVKEINAMVEDTGVAHVHITQEDLEHVDTAEKWDLELEALHDLVRIAEHSDNLDLHEVVDIYAEIKVTILCKKILLDVTPELVETLPVVSNYYDEETKNEITDWEAELDAIVDSIDKLDAAGIENLDDLLNDDSKLTGEMMFAFSKSIILKKALQVELNKALENAGLEKDLITKEDIDAIDTVEKWDTELVALRDLVKLNDSSDELTFSEIVEIYDDVKATSLCYEILLESAPTLAESLPVVSNYYDPETVTIDDWAAELDAIVASVDALDKANLENFNDLLAEDSPLDGEMMLTFTQSIILKNAVVDEINKALENAGLEPDLITVADVESLDTEAKWDAELSAMRNLITLKDDAATLEFSEIVTIYDEVRATTLCNKVLIASAPTMAETLPVVKDYYDDSVVIDDWAAELDAIVASVDALDKANLENFNDLLAEDSPLDGEMMLTFTQSIILKNAVVDEINKALENSGLESGLITVADVDTLDTEAKWDAELSAMRNLITLKDDAATLEFSEIVTIYNEVRATTLCNKVLIASAPTMAETLPVVKDYYDDSVVIDDWGKELDAIVASVDALDKANLEDFSDLLSSDSPLDGEMMLTFTQSIILKSAVVEEINKALENSGLESGLITVADIDTLDTEAKWDAELSAMRNLITLKDNAATLEFSEIVTIYDEVRATTLCNKVLIASAPTMAETLPVVKDYYDDSVLIDDWGKELDAIVDTLDALSAANATNISNPLAEDSPLNGKVLNAATKSTILTKAIVDEMNTAVKNAGLAENIITVENVQAVDTEAKWDAELGCMRRLVAIDFASSNMTAVIDIYDDIKENTILCNSILVSSAAIIIPDLPIISTYYDENTMVIGDWGQELDAIVNAYKLLVNKGVDAITNPIETLDGQIIMACLDSVILRSAFITEFNNNLDNLELSTYYTMDEAKLEELDTAEKWDKELDAIKAVSDLVTHFNLLDPELSTKVNNVKNQVEDTVIASAILTSFLTSMGM